MPRLFSFWLWAFALLAAVPFSAPAQPPATPAQRPPGTVAVARVDGAAVSINKADSLTFPLRAGSLVYQGMVVRTDKDSSIVLVFSNGATVNLGANTELSIDEFLQSPLTQMVKVGELIDEPTTSTTRLFLRRGELISNVKKLKKTEGSTFSIETPVGAAGIRGTTFRLKYLPQGNRAAFGLTMVEGLIELVFNSGNARSVMVGTNKEVLVSDIAVDPATGDVIQMPAVGAPTDVPLSTQATLQQWIGQALDAANTLPSFEPASLAPNSASPTLSPTTATPSSPSTTTQPANSPLPASPAVAPNPNTTSGDGK
jgi:FecR protein